MPFPPVTMPPTPAPVRGESTASFSEKINSLVQWYPSLVGDVNAFGAYLDAEADAIEADRIAAQAALASTISEGAAAVAAAVAEAGAAESSAVSAAASADEALGYKNTAETAAAAAGAAAGLPSLAGNAKSVLSVNAAADGVAWASTVDVIPVGQVVYSESPLGLDDGYLPCLGESYLRASWPAVEGMFKGPIGSTEEVDLGITTYNRICYAGDGYLIFYSMTSSNIFRSNGGDPTVAANYTTVSGVGLNVRSMVSVGGGVLLASDGNNIIRSTDYGATWSAFVHSPNTTASGCIIVDDGHGTFLVSASASSGLLVQTYTADGGLTWTNLTTTTNLARTAYSGEPGIFIGVRADATTSIVMVDTIKNVVTPNHYAAQPAIIGGSGVFSITNTKNNYYVSGTARQIVMRGVGDCVTYDLVLSGASLFVAFELYQTFGYDYFISGNDGGNNFIISIYNFKNQHHKTIALEKEFALARGMVFPSSTTPVLSVSAHVISDQSWWTPTSSGRYWNLFRPDPDKFVTPFIGENYYIKAA